MPSKKPRSVDTLEETSKHEGWRRACGQGEGNAEPEQGSQQVALPCSRRRGRHSTLPVGLVGPAAQAPPCFRVILRVGGVLEILLPGPP